MSAQDKKKPAPTPVEQTEEEKKRLGKRDQLAEGRMPQLNKMEIIARKVASPYRRAYGELERMQGKKEHEQADIDQVLGQITDFIKGELNSSYPDIPVIIDEELPTNTAFFMIDPCGSRVNFEHARQEITVTMAYVDNNKVRCAYVYQPIIDSYVTYEQDGGLKSEVSRYRVSGRKSLNNTVVSVFSPTTQSTDKSEEQYFSLLKILRTQNVHTRTSGNIILDILDVAAGRSDALFASNIAPKNAFLAHFFMKEAGGYASEISGNEIDTTSTDFVLGNPNTYKELLDVL